MAKINIDDTIVAISTPIGEGGIGIVRLSGKDSLKIANRIFKSKSGKSIFEYESFTTHYGFIFDCERQIDEVILTIMKAPYSYTKEDAVEINCHSGIVPLREVLELTLKEGARLAEPGEFTKRAFLNGRIDLIEAEAVLDIIKAKTDLSLKYAMKQLEGGLSKRINLLKEGVLDVLANIEASIDFPEEGLDFLTNETLVKNIDNILSELDLLINESKTGVILREGLLVVICGKPNVGKSTLLNTLLKKERAIVTPVPGTTRDTIEESINIKGIQLRLVDTAGITETEDLIEIEGIARSKKYIEDADIILFLLDNGTRLEEDDMKIANLIKDSKNVLVVINKMDLEGKLETEKINEILPDKSIMKICAKDGTGIKELKEELARLVFSGSVISSDEAIVTNARHRDALIRTKEALIEARKDMLNGRGSEFIYINIREALDFIGIIIGEVYTEELLERIFSKFCIGK
ncbi:MAG: tRNA uridine-5-carboxymethylaminomethyl(34) synthesis GTPase MnmE [Candidatus Omnitrophica bacterium]|nr:tRNA uridine-5-carboxymethylaminomethyl(34) synthesis GTPase MnmE [Candidatus Omnitrophota bacterium]